MYLSESNPNQNDVPCFALAHPIAAASLNNIKLCSSADSYTLDSKLIVLCSQPILELSSLPLVSIQFASRIYFPFEPF